MDSPSSKNTPLKTSSSANQQSFSNRPPAPRSFDTRDQQPRQRRKPQNTRTEFGTSNNNEGEELNDQHRPHHQQQQQQRRDFRNEGRPNGEARGCGTNLSNENRNENSLRKNQRESSSIAVGGGGSGSNRNNYNRNYRSGPSSASASSSSSRSDFGQSSKMMQQLQPRSRNNHNSDSNIVSIEKEANFFNEIWSDSDWTCVVCCQHYAIDNSKAIYAIGPCNHLVCYHCSTKMRVLCEQYECPICRGHIPEVIFTPNRDLKFSRVEALKCIQYNSVYKIYFENDQCLQAFNKLLEHRCGICNNDDSLFDTLEGLEVHLKREHDMFLCELCVARLKVFSYERKYYTRKNLQRHKNSGDPDNRSHRGHPLCDLCDNRFMDEEDLLRHLRRDHYHCHFCSVDSPSQFFDTYERLRLHFKSHHFLCEEGSCRDEKFTSVFRSEIDLQAHRTQMHCMNKSDLRNARTIRVDLNIQRNPYNPSNSSLGIQQTAGRHEYGRSRNDNQAELQGAAAAPSSLQASQSLPTADDFPELPLATPAPLGDTIGAFELRKKQPNKPKTFSARFNPAQKNLEEFPELHSNTERVLTFAKPAVSKNTFVSGFKYRNYRSDVREEQAQSTSGVGSVNRYADISANSTTGNASIREDEFPSLPMLKVKKTKKKTKQSKLTENERKPKFPLMNLAASAVVAGASPSNKPSSAAMPSSTGDSNDNSQNVVPLLSEDFPGISEMNGKKMLSLKVPPGLAKMKPLTSNSSNRPAKPPPGYANESNSQEVDDTLESLARQLVSGSMVHNSKPANEQGNSISEASGAQDQKNNFRLPKSSQSTSNGFNQNQQSQPDDRTPTFIYPPDFDNRNVQLLRMIKQTLKEDSAFFTFKNLTEKFRRSQIDGPTYYKKCLDLFGKKEFNQVFAELVVLMPHPGKQNELLSAYEKYLNASKGAAPKKIVNGACKGVWTIRSDDRIDFLVCPKCQQVLARKDGSEHIAKH